MKFIELFLKYQVENREKSIVSRNKSDGNEELSIKSDYSGEKISVIIKPKKRIKILELFMKLDHKFNPDDRIFLNGFQSWTESREAGINETIKGFSRLLMPILNQYGIKNFGDSNFIEYSGRKGEFHGFTYTYIKSQSDKFYFSGSINEASGYTIYKFNTKKNSISIMKDCRDLIIDKDYHAFDLVFYHGNEREVFKKYFGSLKIKKRKSAESTGWTSWYNYFTDISEEIILKNLNNFYKKKIPIDIFQIDDGYQNAVGDWLDIKDCFPNGMKHISDKIKKYGYKPGLWLAPFICQKKSSLYENHKDWILRDEKNNPIMLGYSKGYWNDYFYALDFYNKDFRAYIKRVLDTVVNKWGFDMLKLDLLYALTIYPVTDKSRSRVMFDAMEFLRDILGNRIILGCGVPLAPSFGTVDFCRIGNDVALTWENNLYKVIRYRERVSVINSLLCTIYRRQLNGNAFLNDPDVYILRKENNRLTREQRFTLFVLNQIFAGLVFTSDDIGNYDKNTLNLYCSQFPFKKKDIVSVEDKSRCYRIDFNIGKLEYSAFSNLSSHENIFQIENGVYFSSTTKDFYNETTIKLMPYQSTCLLKVKTKNFAIAGSTGHLFPGSEVRDFSVRNNNLILRLEDKLINKGRILILIPNKHKEFKVNNKVYKSKRISLGHTGNLINILEISY